MTGRALLSPPIPESAWQSRVTDYATLMGWAWYHTRDSRRSPEGYPDLTLVRDRVVFAELKSERGRLTRDQERWRDRLCGAGAEWYLWRPSDWGEVVRVLGRGQAGPVLVGAEPVASGVGGPGSAVWPSRGVPRCGG